MDQIIIDKSLPVVLVSAWFGSTDAHSHLYSLTSGLKRFPPLMPWPDIERVSHGSPIKDTIGAFKLFLGDVLSADPSFDCQPGDDIGLLHITDLHHGAANFFAGEAFGIKAALENLTQPSFLTVTGDISNRGRPSEFTDCLTMVNDLLNHNVLVGQQSLPTNRVMMTPGNHDVNWSLAISAFIQPVLDKEEKVEGFKVQRGAGSTVSDADINLAQMGLRPLVDFMQQVSGPRRLDILDSGFRYISDFAMAGIHFLELNVEEFSVPPDYPPVLPISKYNKMIKAAAAAIAAAPNGDCIVVLVHRVVPDGDERKQQFNELIQNLARAHPVMVLCGHIHENKIGYDADLKALCVGGMCLGRHRYVEAGERPSFRHLVFRRKNGSVSQVDVNLFEKPPRETWSLHRSYSFKSQVVKDGDFSWVKK